MVVKAAGLFAALTKQENSVDDFEGDKQQLSLGK